MVEILQSLGFQSQKKSSHEFEVTYTKIKTKTIGKIHMNLKKISFSNEIANSLLRMFYVFYVLYLAKIASTLLIM